MNGMSRWATPSTLNLEPERVKVYRVAITDIERAPLINDMAETVKQIGLSRSNSEDRV